MTYKNGLIYNGTWEDGRRVARGSLTYPDDDDNGRVSYVGEWKYDQMNGMGTMTWKNRDTYTGHWENDTRCLSYQKLQLLV
jgi:hypothetical protein